MGAAASGRRAQAAGAGRRGLLLLPARTSHALLQQTMRRGARNNQAPPAPPTPSPSSPLASSFSKSSAANQRGISLCRSGTRSMMGSGKATPA